MKIHLSIILLFFIAQNSFGQAISRQPRALQLISKHKNYTIERLKKNKKGEIIRLEQITLEQKGDTLISVTETYKKNKFWIIRTTRDIIVAEKEIIKEPEGYYVVREIDQKIQELGQSGWVSDEFYYISGSSEAIHYSYYYYPKGNLKLVAELKDGKLWNIITFKKIYGSEHTYGNYKNGVGTISWLNDAGEPCEECSFENHQLMGAMD